MRYGFTFAWLPVGRFVTESAGSLALSTVMPVTPSVYRWSVCQYYLRSRSSDFSCTISRLVFIASISFRSEAYSSWMVSDCCLKSQLWPEIRFTSEPFGLGGLAALPFYFLSTHLAPSCVMLSLFTEFFCG